MIYRARDLHPSKVYSNLNFQATDGISMDFISSDSIDVVFSYEVFQHMPSPEIILKNLSKTY